MNDRELLALVAETDRYPSGRPLPDGWEPDRVDASRFDARRSTSMSTIEQPRQIHPNLPPPTGRRWRGAIAAAVVVIVAIAVGLLVRDRAGQDVIEEQTTTTTQAAPITTVSEALPAPIDTRGATALAITEAFYSLDEQALLDAIGGESAAGAVVRAQMDAAALNTVLAAGRDVVCTPTDGDTVTCAAVSSNDLKSALNVPTVGDQMRVSFADADVVAVEFVIGGDTAIRRFTDWVDANDPDRAMSSCGQSPTVEELAICWGNLIALVPGYYNQTDVGGGSFGNLSVAENLVDAWLAGDSDSVTGLTSDIFNPNLLDELDQAVLLNTTVVRRDDCVDAGTNLVQCTLVVEDDFLREFAAERTDTLSVFFVEEVGYIVDARWESVAPDSVEAFWIWLDENRPGIAEGPCLATSGTLPDDPAGCWEARITAVADYLAEG